MLRKGGNLLLSSTVLACLSKPPKAMEASSSHIKPYHQPPCKVRRCSLSKYELSEQLLATWSFYIETSLLMMPRRSNNELANVKLGSYTPI